MQKMLEELGSKGLAVAALDWVNHGSIADEVELTRQMLEHNKSRMTILMDSAFRKTGGPLRTQIVTADRKIAWSGEMDFAELRRQLALLGIQ
jgi:hypothetical protein